MKVTKLLLPTAVSFALLVTCLCSCNENAAATKEPAPAASASVQNYPYTIEHPDNWEIGSNANTLLALQCLKAWEEGKMDESMKYFGDSIRVEFEGIDKKMANDSLKAFLSAGWNKTIKERMSDFESVISKDKTEEWVTLWYTQSWETKEGAKDSVSIINDLQIKNGKIVRLSEHTRKFH